MQPSNSDIAKKISSLNGRFTKFRREIRGDMEMFKDSVDIKLQPFHDYLQQEKGAEKERGLAKGGKINKDEITKMLVQTVLMALTIIGVLLGVQAI